MSIKVSEITDDQADRIIFIEESQFQDVKAIEITPARLTKTMAAFANSDGGELFVGIDEDRSTGARAWRGFDKQEAANGHIQIFEKLFPLGNDFQYEFLRCGSKTGLVLKIELFRTRAIKVASDGKPYIRRGAQNLPITTPAEHKNLEYCKGISSFETELTQADDNILFNTIPTITFMTQVVPTAEPNEWFKKQMLIREGKATVAGILLFSDEPQAVLPKRCGIKVYRYKTKAEGSRETLAFQPETIEGNLYDQIKNAVEFSKKTIETIPKLGVKDLESVKYPEEALHEIITNAVIHRDYSVADDVHIRIYDNRVEVQSPGILPAHVTVRNILEERFARNGSIVRILNKFPDPPNKDVGEGLNTAFDAMIKLGLKEPVISEIENNVLVMIKHETLASPEETIVEYLKVKPQIKNAVAREICHINEDYRIKKIFSDLMEKGLIEKVPNTRTASTAYRLKRI